MHELRHWIIYNEPNLPHLKCKSVSSCIVLLANYFWYFVNTSPPLPSHSFAKIWNWMNKGTQVILMNKISGVLGDRFLLFKNSIGECGEYMNSIFSLGALENGHLLFLNQNLFAVHFITWTSFLILHSYTSYPKHFALQSCKHKLLESSHTHQWHT